MMKKKASATTASATDMSQILPFGKKNYIFMFIGLGLIALGFFLMSTEDFIDASEFSLSLYVCPFLIVGGFAEIIYAIMLKPEGEASAVQQTANQEPEEQIVTDIKSGR